MAVRRGQGLPDIPVPDGEPIPVPAQGRHELVVDRNLPYLAVGQYPQISGSYAAKGKGGTKGKTPIDTAAYPLVESGGGKFLPVLQFLIAGKGPFYFSVALHKASIDFLFWLIIQSYLTL
jgi:hypothetical protein